jgi:hypothetical protein
LRPLTVYSETIEDASGSEQPGAAERFKRFEVVFEPDACYTDLEFILALTQKPILHVGESRN